ncbi:hypothetical protein [Kitasatospora sp. NPDC050543]|uniref:hypothetical protein n=1 Tax=Kitasatospora sp. NPDC050543 TaxID=3364054 RepID=UPI003791603C
MPDSPLTERVIAELSAFGSRPTPGPATDHHHGDLHSYTVRTLLALMPLAQDPDGVLSAIARTLRLIDTSGFMGTQPISDRAPDLLRAAFEPDNGTKAAYTDLSPGRQDLLRTLADLLPADAYDHWMTGPYLQQLLAPLGVPDTGPALRSYTGLPPNKPITPTRTSPTPGRNSTSPETTWRNRTRPPRPERQGGPCPARSSRLVSMTGGVWAGCGPAGDADVVEDQHTQAVLCPGDGRVLGDRLRQVGSLLLGEETDHARRGTCIAEL